MNLQLIASNPEGAKMLSFVIPEDPRIPNPSDPQHPPEDPTTPPPVGDPGSQEPPMKEPDPQEPPIREPPPPNYA